MKHTLLIILLFLFACTNQQKNKSDNNVKTSEPVPIKTVSYDSLHFDLEPDIRLFTAMALANISGYDYENTVMSAERLEMRSYLDTVLSDSYKEKIAKTYRSTNSTIGFTLGSKALNLSQPPKFEWLSDSLTLTMPYFNRDEKFVQKMSDLYLEANIQVLWSKFYPELKKVNYEYAPFTKKAINDIVKFCGVSENYFDSIKFHFNICPFMQNESGFTCSSKRDIFIIVSPRKTSPGPDTFYHEALHHIVNPMVDKYKFLIAKYSGVANIGKESRSNVYGYIDGFFAECMVRTIDYILREKYYNWNQEKIKEEINRQYGYGFTLIPFFYEKLVEVKDTSETLEEYMPILINQIDIEKEKTRWKDFEEEKNESTNANIL